MTEQRATEDAIHIERTMRASPERVFRAFLDPNLIRQWMTPRDLVIDRISVDPKVGGRIFVSHSRDGASTGSFQGEFLKIVPNRQLVYRWAFVGTEPENGEYFETLVTITLRPVPGGRSRVTVVHEKLAELRRGAPHVHSEVLREWNNSLDKLENSLCGAYGHPASTGRGSPLRNVTPNSIFMSIDRVMPEMALRFVTREKGKIDRIACPWVIRRFVDPEAEFLFVPREKVAEVAREKDAIPFDTPGAELHHFQEGGEPRVTFDAVLRKYGLTDPALLDLAEIVRGADARLPTPRPESAGLKAIATGFLSIAKDDLDNLRLQFPVYDALYAHCRARIAVPGGTLPGASA